MGTHQAGVCPAWSGVGGTHLVKEAVLADELLSSLGVDSDGESHMCHQELGGGAREDVREVQTCACVFLGPPGALSNSIWSTVEDDARPQRKCRLA